MNTSLYGQQLYNNLPEPLESNNFISIASFNGIRLDDCGKTYILESDYRDLGNINIQAYDSPFQDGGGVLSSYMTEKTIKFKIFVKEDTKESLGRRLDELKKNTNKQEGKLIINNGYDLRYCYATLTNLTTGYDVKDPTRLSNLELTFVSKTPHLISTTPIAYVENTTDLTYPIDITNIGSEETEYVISILFNTGTVNCTKVDVVKDGYTLSVTNTFAPGDILKIDGEKKICYKNTVKIDYDGIFVPMNLGSNPMMVNFTATTVDADVAYSILVRYR